MLLKRGPPSLNAVGTRRFTPVRLRPQQNASSDALMPHTTSAPTSIVKNSKDVKDVFYKFSLILTDNESGTIEWADEKEIRKTKGKSTFGL